MTAAILLTTGISLLAAAPASALSSDANLSTFQPYNMDSMASISISPTFSSGTTNYTASTSASSISLNIARNVNTATVSAYCNGTLLMFSAATCNLNSGANTFEARVTAQDSTTTKTYTLTITKEALSISSTSTISNSQANPTIVVASTASSISANPTNWTFGFGSTGLTWRSTSSVNGTITIGFTGTATCGGTLTITAKASAFVNPTSTVGSNTLTFVIPAGTCPNGGSSSSSSSSQTAEQIAAAAAAVAKAAAEAAAAVRAAEIATAQTALATVLKADKAGTLSEYRSANINITTNAALTRLNAEVLKLSAADRADFAKIKAIADKIEFDESFFNATARPTAATYSTYGVTGVTERILPTINAKVLELPASARLDVKAIQEIAKVENFVDRVANPATRSTVSATGLIANGVLSATSPYKYSVVRNLGSYPEGSLNTKEKIEAAIKAEIYKAEAPKRRLAEIKAQIAARNK